MIGLAPRDVDARLSLHPQPFASNLVAAALDYQHVEASGSTQKALAWQCSTMAVAVGMLVMLDPITSSRAR